MAAGRVIDAISVIPHVDHLDLPHEAGQVQLKHGTPRS